MDFSLKGITDLFKSSADSGTLTQYDVVVPLDVGSHAMSDNQFLYVNKDGEGEIVEISPEELSVAEQRQDINMIPLETLSPEGAQRFAQKATVNGANVMLDNLSHYDTGQYGRIPFDPEHPENVSADKMQDIEDALKNIRGDLLHEAAPTANYTKDGDFDGFTKNVTPELEQSIKDVDMAIEQIETAKNLDSYRDDLKAQLDDSDLTLDQKQNVEAAIDEAPTPQEMQQDNVPIPGMGIQ